MPIIKITKADLLKTTLTPDGWYGLIVSKIGDLKLSAKGSSYNLPITFTVEKTGKEIDVTFNSTLWGKLAEPHKALTGVELPADGGEFDPETWMGKKCDGLIGKRPYEGIMYDDIQKYVAYGKGAMEKAPF